MNDHKPPTSLDKPSPGEDHANIPSRVTRLEVMVDEVILRLDRLDAKVDRLDHKIDVGLEKLNDKIDAGSEKLNDKIDAGLEKLNDKIDANREATIKQFEALNARFDRFYHVLFVFLTAIIASLFGLLAKVLGVI